MKAPILLAESGIFGQKLCSEVHHVRRFLSRSLGAALVTSGLTGIALLSAGIATGAAVDRSGYVIGGLLAVVCLLLFVNVHEALEATSILLELLEIDDAIRRDDVIKLLVKCMHMGKEAIIPDDDFDDLLQEAMGRLPSKMGYLLKKSLLAGPALAALAFLVCTLYILLWSDMPSLLSALSIAALVLATGGASCGFAMQQRVASMIRAIELEEVQIHTTSASLLSLHKNMLRRKLASTAKGP